MIFKRSKQILSGILAVAYILTYTAPMALCATLAPQINAGVQKPVLRQEVKSSALKLEGDIAISKKNPKVSLSLRDSDVKQVLRMFADKAGLNIIFHSSVDGSTVSSTGSGSNSNSGTNSNSFGASSVPGNLTPISSPTASSGSTNNTTGSSSPKITMDLVNVPLNDAFRMVLQVSGLTYYIDNNTIVIASAAAAQSLNLAKQELMIIPVKYVDASVLATFLNKNIFAISKPGLSNAQIAITNPNTNEILIFGTQNDYLMAKKVIAQFDVKPLDETFTVNHTTPKEMATLLCNVLFKASSSTNSSGSNSNSNSNSGSGSGSSSGSSTSSAPSSTSSSSGSSSSTSSSSSSSSSSGSSSSGSSGGTTTSGVVLGEGIVACQFDNAVDTGTLASLNTRSLSIMYFPQKGFIEAVGGSAQQMDLIKNFIAKNDIKQPQAYLEVSIIELSEDGSRDFQNTWNVYSSFFTGGFNGTTATSNQWPNFITGDSVTVYDSATNKYAPLYNLGRFSGTPTVTYTMSYLIKNGKGRVLANPRIMITNGVNSKIDLSSDYVKQITSQVVTSTMSSNPTIQKTYTIGSDEGIVINITPFISPDGYVTLNITPNYATEKEQVTDYNASTNKYDLVATLLQRRNLDLKNVRIKDGETLVIGGMIRETEAKNVSKLPVLGDLPGVGMFFRNTNTTKKKEELVIMLTPKIIKESEDVVNNQNQNTAL